MKDNQCYITEEIEIRNHNIKRTLLRETECMEPYLPAEKLKVGVIGISPGAGGSFLSTCLAKFLANTKSLNPAVIELGSYHLYDSLGLDKHFVGREYCKFFSAIDKGYSLRGKRNIEEGINWILRCPEEYGIALNDIQKLGLINAVSGNVIICDFAGGDKDCLQLLYHMDKILVVIDPLPSKMLSGYDFLQSLKALSSPEKRNLYIINKFNSGVNRREMAEFVKVEKPIYLPMINQETIYTSEYSCKVPYSLQEVRSNLYKPLKEIVTKLYQ